MKNFTILLVTIIIFISAINAQVPTKVGWNLISVPVNVPDGRKTILFPKAISPAYEYENGYITEDTLVNGVGYWLKFDSAEAVFTSGDTIFVDTIHVRLGWNMIGSITSPVDVRTIKSEPPGIIVSQYFCYVPGVGYQQTDSIQPGKGYWIKVNQNGTIILNSNVKFECGTNQVFYSGKTYNTVQVGAQCWLKENLNVGTRIDGIHNQTYNSTIEKYCYNNDPNNCDTYGGLYQWDEAMQYGATPPGARGICPTGWHIPTTSEFQTLSTTVGGDGNALKREDQGSGDGQGTNTSGFSALLAGIRYEDGYFYSLGGSTYFWSSTELDAYNAYYMILLNDSTIHYDYTTDKEGYGGSVRCIKD
jgi:uncharacterized protein (TIGR02145 family)